MTQTGNRAPYYDDYDPSKGFHRIMFHPARPLQARELTQMQSILQEQVKRHGDHIFQNGTVVIPGHVYYDNRVKYLKLTSSYSGSTSDSYITSMVGTTIIGGTNGVEALVLATSAQTATDPTTLFIKYTSANGAINEFVSGEVITVPSLSNLNLQIVAQTDYAGSASICTVNDGVYYVNGYFVEVLKQTIIISKYSNVASATVGLDYVESLITENDDASLFDNAYGFTNYGAPGAHRLKISLTLSSKAFDYAATTSTTGISFVSLLKIKDGTLLSLSNDTKYAEITKMLARRTADESGDYIVDDFKCKFNEYRSNNRGQWLANTPYLIGDITSNSGKYYAANSIGYSGSVAPTHTYGLANDGTILWQQIDSPIFNNGAISSAGTLNSHISDAAKLNLLVSGGKAYIRGFEVTIPNSQSLVVDKARSVKQESNAQMLAPIGNFILISNVVGVPNVGVIPSCTLKDSATVTVGTGYFRNLEYVSGAIGTSAAIYKMFLFDVNMQFGSDFYTSVFHVTSTSFTADVVLTDLIMGGSVTVTSASNVVTGKGTQFSIDLRVGQQIVVNGQAKLIATITGLTSLTITSTFSATATDVSYVAKAAILQGDASYVKALPHSFVASARNSLGAIDTEYTISKYYTITTTGTSYTIISTGVNETFLPSGHIVFNSSDTVMVAPTYVLNGDLTQLTINGLIGSKNYSILAIMKRVGAGAKEKFKTLTTKTITLTSGGTYDSGGTLLNSRDFTKSIIELTEADVIKVLKVTQSQNATLSLYDSAGEVDITDKFRLNSNVTSEAYLQSDIQVATNEIMKKPIRITFEYFEHSAGDYFSVNSYTNLKYEDIPNVFILGKSASLRDCLDFRARIADDGSGFGAAGASVPNPIISTTTMGMSYSYYLGRADLLTLSPTGDFHIINGTSLIPPDDDEHNLSIATLFLAPYTTNSASAIIDYAVHKRYTMSNIGQIDARLKSVEYYVALSELEKDTANAAIIDINGLDRFKNGFIADSFENWFTLDTTARDVSCTIDNVNNQLYPAINREMVSLVEDASMTGSTRKANRYTTMGNYVCIDYDEVAMISQLQASRSENINPFAVVNYKGKLLITPPLDNWAETKVNTNTVTR